MHISSNAVMIVRIEYPMTWQDNYVLAPYSRKLWYKYMGICMSYHFSKKDK